MAAVETSAVRIGEANPRGISDVRPDNDNRLNAPAHDHGASPPWRRSEFPQDAVARIYKPSRSAMTSGRARNKGWRLVFERRSPPFVEPLMGYTGSRETLTQVELEFPTLESAIRYAERQGFAYVVQFDLRPSEARAAETRSSRPEPSPEAATESFVTTGLTRPVATPAPSKRAVH
jgi:hypothetical protein